ncbi:hypothetical protein RND81_08G035200 [Saponaria officinalis]|uniref:Cytochrome P450 n=1 Tax=Saponaria officinalis TaxID=3572 RepID=A0AAW1J3S4_SAPOF
MEFILSLIFIIILVILTYTIVTKNNPKKQSILALPGPRKLPIIGNLHQLVSRTTLPHRRLSDLSSTFGPVMHLTLGEVPTIILSSADAAKEAMKTHDSALCSRPRLMMAEVVFYGCSDIALAPYSEYWRHVRKIATLELFTGARVHSFRMVRVEEVMELIKCLSMKVGNVVNLSQMIFDLSFTITLRIAMNKKGKDEREFRTLFSDMTEIASELFGAGSETSSTTIEWAIAELLKNKGAMEKATDEVCHVLRGKEMFDDTSCLVELKYLKNVIKETLRLHPPFPLLVPRIAMQRCQINGHEIAPNTRVFINAWAIGRDAENWKDPDKFNPERFEGSLVDYKGNYFELIPFGAGRRMCPGIGLGVATIELALAMLIYHFDWKLPRGTTHEDLWPSDTIYVCIAVYKYDDTCMIYEGWA